MAKRSVDKIDSERLDDIDETIEVVEYTPQHLKINLPVSNDLPVMLQIDCNLKIRGSVSGKDYFFPGAGSVVDVDERDVPKMLEKALGRPCCSPTPTKYFVLAY